MKIYQEFSASEISEQTDPAASAPESDSVITLDDHAFWKYVHRDQFLEKIHKTLAGMSGASSLGLYGKWRPGAVRPEIEPRSFLSKKKVNTIFIVFLRRFAVHREEIHTDTQSFRLYSLYIRTGTLWKHPPNRISGISGGDPSGRTCHRDRYLRFLLI